MKRLTVILFPNHADAVRRRNLEFLLLAILLSLLVTGVIVLAMIFYNRPMIK
jgi:hypothetical protein